MDIRKNIELNKYSTWQIGGPAKIFIEISSDKDFDELVDFLDKNKTEKIHILGDGSNTLFDSRGFNGIVIHIKNSKLEELSDLQVSVGAGTKMSELVKYCLDKSLTGIEEAFALPGTVGGAIRGNSGCFGWEMKDNVVEVSAMNLSTNERRKFRKSELDYSYRDSFFKKNPEWIVVDSTLNFSKGDKAIIREKMKEIAHLRKDKQPQSRTCGSVFMNPKELLNGEKTSAGFLIDQVGLKGYSIGGVRVSEKHGNFFENFDPGISTSDDILELIQHCQKVVKEKFGIELIPEVKLIEA